jgi:hypothetical protein
MNGRVCEKCDACKRFICFVGVKVEFSESRLICPACSKAPSEAERLIAKVESRDRLFEYIAYATRALKGNRALWPELSPVAPISFYSNSHVHQFNPVKILPCSWSTTGRYFRS